MVDVRRCNSGYGWGESAGGGGGLFCGEGGALEKPCRSPEGALKAP